MSDMTMRDQFATAALTGVLANEATQKALLSIAEQQEAHTAKVVAQLCYEYADEMLKARQPNPSNT